MKKRKILDEKCDICGHRQGVHNQVGGCNDCWKEYRDDCKKKGIPMYFGMPEKHDFTTTEGEWKK